MDILIEGERLQQSDMHSEEDAKGLTQREKLVPGFITVGTFCLEVASIMDGADGF